MRAVDDTLSFRIQDSLFFGTCPFTDTCAFSQKYLPAPAKDIKILLCGPPPMINAMKAATESLGYEKARAASKLEDQVFSF